MTQKKFDYFLENPIEKVKSSNDILMKMFWYIILKERITIRRWNKSIHEYVNNPENGIRQTGNTRTEARSNLRQSLVKGKLTWMVFNRAIKALGIKRAEIIFRYSFDEDDSEVYKEFKLPILTFRGKSKNGRKDSKPTKADDGDSRS